MRTLKTLNIAIFSLLFVISTNAQYSIGAKIGANFADTRVDGLLGDLAPEQTTFTGFTAGIMAEIPMTDALSFRPELNYIQKGFTVGKSFDVSLLGIDMPIGAKARTRLNYIEMPLLLKYSIGSDVAKVYAIAGPNISYATSAELRPIATFIIDFNLPKVNIDLSDDIYNRMEVSGTMGLGGEVKAGNGKIFADARYTLGFTNMLNSPIIDMKIKNQGFNISAGYAYNF